MKYIIGTRGSKLAMAQADSVRVRLAEAYPDHEFEIRVIRTTGDQILNKPLHEIGGKGVFVREIEEELLNHKADIGVHSMKDMPSCPGPGLVCMCVWVSMYAYAFVYMCVNGTSAYVCLFLRQLYQEVCQV